MPSVGRPVPRKDAWDEVTGGERYFDDSSFPSIVFGRQDETLSQEHAYPETQGMIKPEKLVEG